MQAIGDLKSQKQWEVADDPQPMQQALFEQKVEEQEAKDELQQAEHNNKPNRRQQNEINPLGAKVFHLITIALLLAGTQWLFTYNVSNW